MMRKIIRIDSGVCNGCGICVEACHEGAIGMVEGKAKLLRESYCDGLGDCLPTCPTGAITFEEREAAAYDEAAVKAKQEEACPPLACGCSGTHVSAMTPHATCEMQEKSAMGVASQLRQWPVQIQLVPANASYLQGAKLLIAADCTAYAYGNFHQEFMKDHITLIACPKLDHTDYAEKLTAVLRQNEIQSVTVVRMEVPCCGGIEQAVKRALQASGKRITWQVVTISNDGRRLD